MPSTVSKSPAKQPGPTPVWDIGIVALFLTRLLVPAEAVEQGSTLWIASTWLAIGTCRFWWLWRTGTRQFPRLQSTDIGVLALVGGFLLSGLLVLIGIGDRRAALNCCWEWTSVGMMWVLLRERLQIPTTQRMLAHCLLTTIIALAGLGIWQHFVWYPQQSRGISMLLELQQQREAGHALSASQQREFEHLRSEFGTEFLTLNDTGRRMLLDRARFSVEPIGRFALANSFAALLIIGCWNSLDVLRICLLRRVSVGRVVCLCCFVGLIFGCLLLTKSRTAAVAMLVSGGWLILRLLRIRSIPRRTILIVSGVAALVVIGLGTGLALSGGLDWQVLSEAPKSLAYRGEYWQATWRMMQDHPVFGVGPGNFRQNYFAYKLPGSSEEILDPHNLFLDAWANGGLLSLAGLLVLCGLWGRRLFAQPVELLQAPPEASSLFLVSCLVGVFSFGLPLVEEWLFEGFFDETLCWLAAGWLLVQWILSRLTSATSLSLAAALGAGTALFIHLLGAGGLSLPAILQPLLLMLLLSAPNASAQQEFPRRAFAVLAGIGLLLTLGCLWSGLVPVVTTARLIDQGRSEMLISQRPDLAIQSLKAASDSDRLASDPHRDLASLLFSRWERSGGNDDELFEAAIEEQAAAIARDPRAAKEYLTLSQWWTARYDRDRNRKFAQAAVEAAEQGVQLYPNFAPLQMRLAVALSDENRPVDASAAAEKALHLDDLNRERGHVDKLLPPRDRATLEELATPKK